MSVPTHAAEMFTKAGIPTFEDMVKCENNAQFGELTFVIGGKDYPLSSDEWMLPEKSQALAQVGFKDDMIPFGPIGPELTGGDVLL